MVRATIDEKLKRMPRTVRVGIVPGGLSEFIAIQAAINWCATQAVPAPSQAAPYTVEVWPGIYDEQVTQADWVHLKGIGPKGSVVIYQNDANALLLDAGDQEVQNLTLRLGTPSAARSLVSDAGTAGARKFTDVHFEVVTPGAFNVTVFDITGITTITVERCTHAIGGTGASATFRQATAVAGVHVVDNDFEFTNANAFHIISTIAGNWTGGGNRWAGTCGMFSATLGTITLDGDTVVCPVLNVITAGAAIVLLRKSLSHMFALPGMSIQDAVDGLLATGGKIELAEGTFTADAAQIARAIDDVTIRGQGVNTRIELDGVTAVISAGAQDGWILADFDVDAGLVDIAAATNSTLHNITINGLHSTIINPDVGVTRFPGQPVMRLEEIRPLDPAATEIIKQYGRMEHQLYNPTFATPQFIMELLRRQARYMHVPISDLWTDGSTGGSITLYPQYALLTCRAVGGDDGLASCVAAFLNSYVDASTWDRVDFDNMLMVAFDVSRDAGTHADLRGRVQLKQVAAEGVLANDGFGIEIQNYAIYGEAFAGAQGVVNLGVTMTAEYTYRIAIVLVPNVGVYFYVNEVYRGVITAQIPTGPAAGTCYWVLSMDNAAQAVACNLRVSPISYWNHL